MIIYIHGFGSAGGGSKAQKLKEMFPDIEIISPSYDCTDFSTIDMMLDSYDINTKQPLFIGNSLGGFIAMYLAKKYSGKAILLNPATNPEESLKKYIGKNTNFVSNIEFEFTQAHIDSLMKYKVEIEDLPISVYVTKDDDTIDCMETIAHFKGIREITVFEEGGHRFSNLEDIGNDIMREYYNLSI